MKYDIKGYGIIAATTNIEISDNEKSAFTLNDILDLFSEGSEVDISTIESRHKLIDNLSEDRWKYLNAKEQ
jgi:Asp-tRNA(Asn)/Glu-tRNA(Gln) amidotransferase C subunit